MSIAGAAETCFAAVVVRKMDLDMVVGQKALAVPEIAYLVAIADILAVAVLVQFDYTVNCR
jgi:hypothetical protein